MNRLNTRPIKVGQVQIGGQAQVVIQSMTNTHTKDIEATIGQIGQLQAAGCQIVRVAILDMEDALAVSEIKKHIGIPLVCDIHFKAFFGGIGDGHGDALLNSTY